MTGKRSAAVTSLDGQTGDSPAQETDTWKSTATKLYCRYDCLKHCRHECLKHCRHDCLKHCFIIV